MLAVLRAEGHEPTTIDVPVDNSCQRYRPDFAYDLGHTVIVVECDERQHKDRDSACERVRMLSLSQQYGQSRVIFLRFNPDKYRSEAPVVTLRKRYELLIKLLDSIKEGTYSTPARKLSVLYLFYDGWTSLQAQEWQHPGDETLDYTEMAWLSDLAALAIEPRASSSGE